MMASSPHGRIIGGLGSPHAPSIGAAYDRGQHLTAEWKPLFDGYLPIQNWLAEKKPDLIILVYNDHANTFFFDKYPTFSISVAGEHQIADEGWGKRPLAPIPGVPEIAWQIAHSLVDDEFDMTICQEMPLDHGCLTPMSCFFAPERRWTVPLLPICVNVLQPPIPTAMRCFKLGQAIRRAVESIPRDLKVVIAGTGGLTHQLGGERYGHTNTEWDQKILDLMETDPLALANMTHQELMERGGAEGVEIIMWLVMRGALSTKINCIHRNYYLPMVTGFAQAIYEEPNNSPLAERAALTP